MATILSEAAGLLYENLGQPPREVFDSEACTRTVMEAWAFYRHQAGAAVGSLLTGTFFELDVVQKDFLVNQDGFEKAVYVQRRVDDLNDLWEKVEIVSVVDIDNSGDIAEYAIALYGQPPNMRLSWNPALEIFNHLRVWYDPDATEPGTLDDTFDIPINLLKYMIPRRGVLLALPVLAIRAPQIFTAAVIANVGNINRQILGQSENEWDMWRFQSDEEGWSQMEGTMDRFYGRRRQTFPRIS